MSLAINSTNPVTQNTETAHALKTANLAKSQQELEGQMALDLIASAMPSAPTAALPATAVSGQNINIKV